METYVWWIISTSHARTSGSWHMWLLFMFVYRSNGHQVGTCSGYPPASRWPARRLRSFSNMLVLRLMAECSFLIAICVQCGRDGRRDSQGCRRSWQWSGVPACSVHLGFLNLNKYLSRKTPSLSLDPVLEKMKCFYCNL